MHGSIVQTLTQMMLLLLLLLSAYSIALPMSNKYNGSSFAYSFSQPPIPSTGGGDSTQPVSVAVGLQLS